MVQLLSWELRLLGVLVGTLAAATVIHWASSSSRWTASPALRLATAAPLVIAFALAPLLFDRAEPVTTVFTAFLLTWLGIFKMLAWAAGRGEYSRLYSTPAPGDGGCVGCEAVEAALMRLRRRQLLHATDDCWPRSVLPFPAGPLSQQPWSLAQLWALLMLPILPQPAAGGARPRSRADADTSPGTTLQLSLRWLAKLGVTAAVVFALADAGDGAAADAAAGSAVTAGALYRTCLYAVGLYSMLGVAMDGPAALLLRPLGLRLAPHFRSPWLSSSVAEFWNWRWNQAASGVLRHLVYEPIVEGRLVALPRRAAGRSRGGSGGVSSSGAGGGRGGKGADGKAAPGLRQLAGMSAAFVASGVAHEIIFWWVRRGGRMGSEVAERRWSQGHVPLCLPSIHSLHARPRAAMQVHKRQILASLVVADVLFRCAGVGSGWGPGVWMCTTCTPSGGPLPPLACPVSSCSPCSPGAAGGRGAGAAVAAAAGGGGAAAVGPHRCDPGAHLPKHPLPLLPLSTCYECLSPYLPRPACLTLPSPPPAPPVQCILLCTAHWLFMLPAERAGLPGLLAGSMRQTFGAAAAAVLPRQS